MKKFLLALMVLVTISLITSSCGGSKEGFGCDGKSKRMTRVPGNGY